LAYHVMSARLSILIRAVFLVIATFVVSGATTPAPSPTSTIRVPQDQPTLEAAIAASSVGTLILLDGGTYPGDVIVPESRPGITIRGMDRNEVVFDGGDVRGNAIEVLADGVTLENMTAHNFFRNGFYWEEVEGFAGRYLTVWNVGLYGIYSIESRQGVIEDSFVSGAADAAFYVGECNPCDTVVRNVTARLSAVGYSGTNAGGNLEIRDSLWELNGIGIMPNSYDGQPFPAPQHDSAITGNTIRDSGAVEVPANSPLAGYVGVGIAVNGGHDNVIEDNTIEGSDRYGIALFPALQQDGSSYLANGNSIVRNRISDSGTADLAMAGGMQIPSCFDDNEFETSLPAEIEAAMPCDGQATVDTDPQVEADLYISIPEALDRLGERPSYVTMPAPSRQPSMPEVPEDAPAGPRTAGDATLLVVLVGAAVTLVAMTAAGIWFARSRAAP
jgi:hypothetical protein